MMNDSPSSSDEETYLSLARCRSLVDDMRDSPTPSSSSPQKKRRMGPSSVNGMQGLYRKGTRFKTLIDDAFVQIAFAKPTHQAEVSPKMFTLPSTSYDSFNSPSASAVATLARQKTAQCILLQQEMEQIKSEQTQLEALNNELREGTRHQTTRMQKINSALQLASQNAAQARTDADSAEATSATLASQLQALQVVVDETKRASRVLLQEQEDISQKAQSVEQKYVQTQAELVRANSQRQKLLHHKNDLTEKSQQLEDIILEMKTKLQNQEGVTKHWKQVCSELQTLEAAHQQRMQRLERELQESQSLLVDATSTAAETESTATELKTSLEKMQAVNQRLHKQFEEQQIQGQAVQETHRGALQVAQQETQACKLRASNNHDHIQQLTLDKKAQEKRANQLQLKVANLERRLQESTNLVNTTPTSDKTAPFTIPPLGGKENVLPDCKCVICFKDGAGLMKKCQCGKPGCTSKAHASCINKITAGPSVSHPGTPAPRLPVVLCSSTSAEITPLGTSLSKYSYTPK